MTGDDDPFFSAGSDDRTVIRPIPGGRVREPSHNASTMFPDDLQIGPLRHLGQLNPLENAGSVLLGLATCIYNQASHSDPQGLRRQLAEEIRQFHTLASQAGVAPKTVGKASYVLCTTLDEAVFNTPWGRQGSWAEKSLLSEFHGSVAGGEGFFHELRDAGTQPEANLHLLELMYLCLALGFQGRYQLEENGAERLEQIQAWLAKLIHQQRREANTELSPHWKGVRVEYVSN
ncbi:type IVB secretion system protein IcmH/DotU [Candidatus Thiothrix sp. Deng01]|uniref:Type IVB secretion system protein IcmH/DotU n=1 Tax=Candidatus Thiothrix phosphatis TaxID=3112415 RepID=A0ABU6CWS5_9GAMM|nr:type IVB secretion system protein IcmH/DotU [Candidatus Thiothrix sp. Deng01]MEB4591279.1 type IVB secretion system protein IcmH/DotU [Candidatus Thiothrix sp. Deng01]